MQIKLSLQRTRNTVMTLLGASASLLTTGTAFAQKNSSPSWLPSSVIYCTYPEIFSPQGNLAGVTAQIPRLQKLGVTTLWLMPVTTIGKPHSGHPAFNSPYCVQDYYAINPHYGSPADLKRLVQTAHHFKIKVVLDAVLNHTSWDNALIQKHPEYYVHSDGNKRNPASIQQAFNYADVAQLDYSNPGTRAYITQMLSWWVKTYDIDGFRFDSASNPAGSGRKIPADYWQSLPTALEKVKPNLLLLGECLEPELARAPFSLDYGWNVADALKRAFKGGNADEVRLAWKRQKDNYPAAMLHLNLQDTWDASDRDVRLFNSPQGALCAAIFNFTINGVPLLYNGMEAGNTAGAVNPHQKIEWKANPKFPAFYQKLLQLRRTNPALQQGKMAWLPCSAPAQVLSYTRSDATSEFLILVNVSSKAATGRVAIPSGKGWEEVKLRGQRHVLPPEFTLAPQDFAIFRRPAQK